jgi:opacity protein-like surface antigen
MKTRGSLLTGVACLAVSLFWASPPVLAADIAVEPEPIAESNWYVSLHGGIKFDEDWDDDWENGPLTLKTDDGWRAGGAFGYSFSSIFSIEGEASFLNQDFDSFSEDLLGNDLEADGDLSIITGMVNIVVGFPVSSMVRPYIGGGVGIAHVSMDDVELVFPGTRHIDDDDSSFAAQAFLGLDFMLFDNVAIGGRYRVLHISDLEFEDDLDLKHDLDPDLIQSVEIVLTFGF